MNNEREWVQGLLRAGLGLSLILMVLGLSLKITGHNLNLATVTTLDSIFKLGVSPADRIMGLGIITLAFTPVFRVFALLLLWIRERDWRFVGVSAVVLVLLSVAICLGRG